MDNWCLNPSHRKLLRQVLRSEWEALVVGVISVLFSWALIEFVMELEWKNSRHDAYISI